jgi:hypothetical protein
MAASDHLSRYAEGWAKGDPGIILESLDDGYELDDPNSGSISKTALAGYFAAFRGQVEEIRGQTSSPFMEFSDLVTQQEGTDLTAWVWWAVPETPIQGSGLIKVGPNGVLSERLAFYTKLPEA